MRKRLRGFALLVLVSGCVVIGSASNADAAPFQAINGIDELLHFNSGVKSNQVFNSGLYYQMTDDRGYDGASGYVMPNMQGGSYAPTGGAIGETALVVSRTSTANYDRKVALFCFLQKKHGVSLANRDSICAGKDWTFSANAGDRAWEKMGSALIVHQLLRTTPATGRNASARDITATQWSQLKARLVDNSDLLMSYEPAWTTFLYNGSSQPRVGGGTWYKSDLVNTAGLISKTDSSVYDAASVTYWRTDSAEHTEPVWQFTSISSGTMYYALAVNCANPIGGLPGLPTTNYSLEPKITSPANNTTVVPGNTISPSSEVINTGTATNSTTWRVTRLVLEPGASVTYGTAGTDSPCIYFSVSSPSTCDAGVMNTSVTFTANETKTRNSTDIGTYTVGANTASGTRICYAASVSRPTHSSSPTWRHSPLSCVTVTRDYTLTPSITLNGAGGFVERGTTVGDSGTNRGSMVTKAGSTNSNVSSWQTTRFIFAPGVTLPNTASQSNVSNNACNAFTGYVSGQCAIVPSPPDQNTSQRFSTNQTERRDYSYPIPAGTAGGSRVCFVTSVSWPVTSGSSTTWSHSDMKCVTVSNRFNITPTISLTGENGIVDPNGTISGNSALANAGPDTSTSVNWRVTRFIFGPTATMPSTALQTDVSSDPCAAFPGYDSGQCLTSGFTTSQNTNQTVTTSGANRNYSFNIPSNIAAGSRICFVASVNPPTHSDSTKWNHSRMRCVTVRNYDLTPSISVDGGNTVIEPGFSGQVSVSVTNRGDNSRTTHWRLTRFEYTTGNPTTTADPETKNPCDAFTSANRTVCTDPPVWSDDRVFSSSPSTTSDPRALSDPTRMFSVPDTTPVGTKICFVASVSRPTANTTPLWAHSGIVCVTVGKKPKMQVIGGDVRAGGKIETGMSTVGPPVTTYGSWGEYAALSQGCNTGFSSGSGLNNGAGGSYTALRTSWSKLTFANTGIGTACIDQLGNYAFTSSMAGLRAQFAGGDEMPSTDLSDPDIESGTYTVTDIEVTSSDVIPAGKSIIIVASGTVTIGSNIVLHDGPYTSIQDIPQIVIRANEINIKDNVVRVDAWLLGGSLNTCSSHGGVDLAPTDSLTNAMCSNLLEVNGPVAVDKLHLRRTHGADVTSRAQPAERFNLRADAYLWANARGYKAARTVYSIDLPPRL